MKTSILSILFCTAFFSLAQAQFASTPIDSETMAFASQEKYNQTLNPSCQSHEPFTSVPRR